MNQVSGADVPNKVEFPRVTMNPGGVPDMDGLIEEFGAKAGDNPLKVRIPVQVMDPSTGDYTSWSAVRWGLEMSAEDAKQLRGDLDTYLQAWMASRRKQLAARG